MMHELTLRYAMQSESPMEAQGPERLPFLRLAGKSSGKILVPVRILRQSAEHVPFAFSVAIG